MYGYHCGRISLGPFERGPVNLLLEGHTNADFPPNCTASQVPSTFGVLNTFWIDDTVLASYLNTTYGLPVLVSKFQENDQATGSAVGHSWTWGLPNMTASQLTIYDDGTSQAIPAKGDRFFWPRSGGIASLDFQYDRTGPGEFVGNRLATGTLAPPMLLAGVAGGHYAEDGAWYPAMNEGIGTFSQFSDPQCLHPA